MSQLGKHGSWTWRTQTLPAQLLTKAGAWKAQLFVDGHAVATTEFTVVQK